jgi:D-galactose 1-dehydrogenase
MAKHTLEIAIVGVGKIARDQHIPAISGTPAFTLKATASRNAQVGGVDGYGDLDTLLNAHPEITCISLCTPPQVRYADARRALLAGRHVMLEKPPGATLSEVHDLISLAEARGVTLFATWHSRHAASVTAARDWLQGKDITGVEVIWKEDVRRWHPGQEWIWQAGGLGVFDPGINALSVLSAIYPRALHLSAAELYFPENRDTPIAADLTFNDPGGANVSAVFDWRQTGPQTWDVKIETSDGTAILRDGGARLVVDGTEISAGLDHEYRALYAQFSELVATGASDVDLTPMFHVADAFTLGRRRAVAPFDW